MRPSDEFTLPARSVTWELTLRCNARCRHCASAAGKPRPDELSPDEALDLCRQLPAVGTQHVCLFGGEALLRPDRRAITRALVDLGIDVSLATNGIALTEARARELLEDGVVGISISLDAATASVHDELRGRRGAWERAVRAIALTASLGFRERTVITSVSRHNLTELDGIAELLVASPGKLVWMINLATSHTGGRFSPELRLDRDGYLALARAVDRLARTCGPDLEVTGTHDLGYFSANLLHIHDFRWQGCRAGIDTLGIRSDGKVKGCLILPDRHVQGDIRVEPLERIWRDPRRFRINRAFTPDLLEGDCQGCAFGRQCQGGCREVAESYTGSAYAYPFCLYREELAALRGGRGGDRT